MVEINETDLARKLSEMSGNSFIAFLDEQIDIEKKKLMVKMAFKNRREKIDLLAKELEGDIQNLAMTIQNILDKHHKDYVATFSMFMDTVRKDVKLKIEHMEKIEEEKRKLNDVNVIKCERDFFRLESVRMDKLCKTLNLKIEDMTHRMKILSDEVNNLTLKWKDSETVNKQLFVELESSLLNQKEIEYELLEMKNIIELNNQENENLAKNYTKEEEEQKEKFIAMIQKLRSELKQERIKNNKILGDYNILLLEKNNLENIFMDCVEETRKNIYNRRFKENMINKNARLVKKELKTINTKYETFLPKDKKAILESFILNDEVCNIVKDAIFNKRSRLSVRMRTGKKSNQFNLPEVEYSDKMKDYGDNTKGLFKNGIYSMGGYRKRTAKSKPASAGPFKLSSVKTYC